MAVGDFTKEEAEVVRQCINDIFDALPKTKQMDFIGELNEALCFVSSAAKAAPNEGEAELVTEDLED